MREGREKWKCKVGTKALGLPIDEPQLNAIGLQIIWKKQGEYIKLFPGKHTKSEKHLFRSFYLMSMMKKLDGSTMQ